MGKVKPKKTEPATEDIIADIKKVMEEPLALSNTQLQNLVKQEREDKEYYRNVISSAIEYLDAEQTQINTNKQVFKQALASAPSQRPKIQTNPEDNKNKKKASK